MIGSLRTKRWIKIRAPGVSAWPRAKRPTFTSHHPPAPEFLELCDLMGMLVIDGFSNTRTYAKKPNGYARLFTNWSGRDVRAMVRCDRDHPSVILW